MRTEEGSYQVVMVEVEGSYLVVLEIVKGS